MALCLFLAHGYAMQAADSIVWHAESNTLDADIDNKPLSAVAADIKKATGRDIHVPPGMSKMVSVKFTGKSTSEGLSRILDGFNYYTETHENVTRIVIIDPNNVATAPTVARSTIPRPPSPGGAGAFKAPPATSPAGGGGGSLFGNRDSRGTGLLGSGGAAGSSASDRAKQQAAQEALRELYKSGGGSPRGDRPRDGGSDSGRSRNPR